MPNNAIRSLHKNDNPSSEGLRTLAVIINQDEAEPSITQAMANVLEYDVDKIRVALKEDSIEQKLVKLQYNSFFRVDRENTELLTQRSLEEKGYLQFLLRTDYPPGEIAKRFVHTVGTFALVGIFSPGIVAPKDIPKHFIFSAMIIYFIK
jgi:hypothetical protein